MGDFNKGNSVSLACTCGLGLAVFITGFWPHQEMKVMSRMKGLVSKIKSVTAKWQIQCGKAALYNIRSLSKLFAWVLILTLTAIIVGVTEYSTNGHHLRQIEFSSHSLHSFLCRSLAATFHMSKGDNSEIKHTGPNASKFDFKCYFLIDSMVTKQSRSVSSLPGLFEA